MGNRSAHATLAALAIAASTGCTASGYREHYYNKSRVEENSALESVREAVTAERYALGSDSIFALAEREYEMLTPQGRNSFFEKPGAPKSIARAFETSPRWSRYVVQVSKPEDASAQVKEQDALDKLVYQNGVLAKLFQGGLVNRSLFGSAQKATRYDFNVGWTEADDAVMDSLLMQLSRNTLTHAQRKNLSAVTTYGGLSADLKFNQQALDYILPIITARVDIESIEGNIPEMAKAHELSQLIKQSLTGQDDSLTLAQNQNVVRAFTVPLVGVQYEPLREHLGSPKKVNERMPRGKEISSLDQLRLDQVVKLLVAEMTDYLKSGSYQSRHEAMQGPGLLALSIPLLLPGLNPHERSVAHKYVVGELVNAFPIETRYESVEKINTLGLFLLSLPAFGPAYSIVTGGVHDALTPNTFAPEVRRFAEDQRTKNALIQTILCGNGMAMGVRNANWFVGENFTPRLGVSIGIITTAAAVGGAVAAAAGGGGGGAAATGSPPPIGGGGGFIPGP